MTDISSQFQATDDLIKLFRLLFHWVETAKKKKKIHIHKHLQDDDDEPH